ncbi:hypothetical protein RchiOBHm_Chr5g0083521 [Rosa chinensis]|uniref:Uncharacterized protein n=1 Tax=Rosa chinensis TaxID=74649 RepID=A0A2P6QNL7_ROSCH|nr:hypothetical protein RchiOBHm_Chr5g0083521 [Rosa chinensis]
MPILSCIHVNCGSIETSHFGLCCCLTCWNETIYNIDSLGQMKRYISMSLSFFHLIIGWLWQLQWC